MEKQQYVCPKCGNNHYESDQFQATGGNFAKVFDVQHKKFVTISCTAAATLSFTSVPIPKDGISLTS